ncbi:MAG: LA_0442/LA_0875 N-terminal domain-containing protein [Leptospira bouyouniensis]
MKLTEKQILKIATLLVVLSTNLNAENILLKKGGTLKGKVVEQDQYKLKIRKEDGTTVVLSKTEILKVVYKDHLTAAEEDKLRKAEEEKERIKREKEEAARLKKEQEDAARLEKENAKNNAALEAEAKRKQEEEAKLAEAEKKNLTRNGAAWRSAVLPGWGQWKQGRKVQAFVYPSIIAVGLFFTYDKHRMYLNAKRDYNNLDNPYTTNGLIRAAFTPQTAAVSPAEAVVISQVGPFKGQRESVERHYQEMQYIGIATLLVYVWNIFDAYYFHPTGSGLSIDDTRKEKFFLHSSVDRVGYHPTAIAGDRGIEHRTQLGYEVTF